MERISSIHPSYSTTVGKNMDANSHRWFPEGWAHVRSHWKGKGGYRSKSSSSGPSRKPFAFSRFRTRITAWYRHRVETGACFRTRITACYSHRVETGPLD